MSWPLRAQQLAQDVEPHHRRDDGGVRASLPKDITLHAELEPKGVKHTVVAHQHVKPILGLPIATDDSIEIDGNALPLTKKK